MKTLHSHNPTRDQIDDAFAKLQLALQFVRLARHDEHGKPVEYRRAKAREFMLMEMSDERTAFKHSDTRNYVFLMADGTLVVPHTQEAFMRGGF